MNWYRSSRNGSTRGEPPWGPQMADAREVLEMMRQVAKMRLELLEQGTTFHSPHRTAYYLQEYRDRLAAIEKLIRQINIHIVQPAPKDDHQ